MVHQSHGDYLGFLQLSKDLDDETEDIQYSWLREYHWEVCGYFLLFLLSSLKKEKKMLAGVEVLFRFTYLILFHGPGKGG